MIDRWAPGRKKIPGDAWAVGLIIGLTAVVTWHLFYYDAWLLQIDITNQFVPWLAYLGKRLSAGEIPGWNPYQASGAPFAADPQSGWMYFPAMLLFPFLGPIVAFKSLIGLDLLIAGLGTFAFARVMRLGILASLAAAFVVEYSVFSNNPSYCCTVRAETGAWVPLMLLGIELALRSRTWRARVLPWCLAGFALSQIYASWLGQGAVYTVFVFGSFLAYRVLFANSEERGPRRGRLIVGAATAAASGAISAGIAAAGLFPRIALSAETMIGRGNYAEIPNSLVRSPSLKALILNIIGSNNAPRGVAFGGVALVLIWFAPFIARRAYATTYFACLTVSVYILMLQNSPLHLLFYLIPKFHAIHAHNTINVSAIGAIGPAMLAGAAIESLPTWRPRRSRRFLIAAPCVGILAVPLLLGQRDLGDAEIVKLAALATTVVLFISVARSPWTARWAQAALVAMIFLLPTGVQMGSAWVGAPIPSPWRRMANLSISRMAAISKLTAGTDPGNAGEFLQEQLAINGPFRFAGYTTKIDPKASSTNYAANQGDSHVLAILTNARAMALDLYDVSAYNPSQLDRYARFINALNGTEQSYHTTYIKVNGFANHMFPLLNVRYVLVDRRLTNANAHVNQIKKGRHTVYHDKWVTVYETNAPVSPAWIVHSVTQLQPGDVLTAMKVSGFNPRTNAIVEGGQVAVGQPPAGAVESATITAYEPERITIDATAASAGLLVVSEVYESGWKAYLDGEPVEIKPTDYAFRGIALTPGHHTVEFRYEPASLRLGIWVSALTGLIIAALVGWRLASRWRNRPRPSTR